MYKKKKKEFYVMKCINVERDFTTPTLELLEHVRVLISCDHATLFVVDPIKEQLWAKVPDLDKPEDKMEGYPLKMIRVPMADAGVAGDVAKSGEEVFVEEPRKDKRVRVAKICAETGLRAVESVLCAPIFSGDGEVLAVVQFINKALRNFNESDLKLLDVKSRFGKEISYILENAQRVKESIAAKNYAAAGGDWWSRWQEEARQAAETGKTLLVYSRRDWEHRKEPADVHVDAQTNDLWPGHELALKQGAPIAQFTELQQREIEWMQGQGFRLEFRRIETADEIRSDLGGTRRPGSMDLYCNGTTYTGQWSIDGKIQGKGKMLIANGKVVKGVGGRVFAGGDRYEGDFVNGRKVGRGKMSFDHMGGDSYEGDWVADQMHGKGVLDRDGDVYTGMFFDGLRHGQGVQEHQISGGGGGGGGMTPFSALLGKKEPAKKPMSVMARVRAKAQGLLPLRYEGEWKYDQHDGQGKLTRVNEQWELCQYSKGKVVEVLDSGTALEDGTHNDVEYPNGDKYSGPFQGGKMNGENGKMLYKDGRKFIGDWKDGKRHGHGKMFFPDGRKFDGPWKADQMDGPSGEMTYPDGRSYRGDWKGNQKHGKGEHTYVEKEKEDKETRAKSVEKHGGKEKKGKVNAMYAGEYKGNNKHGEGRFEFFNSAVNRWEVSRYKDGVQVEIVKFGTDIADGRTKYKWPLFLLNDLPHRCIPNGDTYDGEWKGGQMSGTGAMVYDNGDTYDGMWENNVPHGTGVSTSAEKKGTWIVARWEKGVEVLRIKKGTKMDEMPNIEELVWMEKVQQSGLTADAKQKIQYGPEILGPGLGWEGRHDVGVEERRCVILCSIPGGGKITSNQENL